MITNVMCDVNHILVPVKSISGLSSKIVPKLTELFNDNGEKESVMMLKIPSDKLISVSKIEFVIEYEIYLNDDTDENEDENEDERKAYTLYEFSSEDQQIIFDLIKNKAGEYTKFCKEITSLDVNPKDDCSYVKTQIKDANIMVKDTKIYIEFSNCDLRKIVKGMDIELCDGGFSSIIDHVELTKGIYYLSASLI